MSDVSKTKEVHFADYCKTCKYGPKQEHEDPCDECLNHPWNEYSHKPVNYKENDE